MNSFQINRRVRLALIVLMIQHLILPSDDLLEISQEDYDRWRYRYPEFANAPGRVNPISQSLSDMLVAGLKEQSEE